MGEIVSVREWSDKLGIQGVKRKKGGVGIGMARLAAKKERRGKKLEILDQGDLVKGAERV